MRHYFLGLAANYSAREVWRHVFAIGTEVDRRKLGAWLLKKYVPGGDDRGENYRGEAILTRNGRSGLALALKAYLEPGTGVLVNGFTCYAVYEAILAAGLIPVWADINREDLNFDVRTLEAALKRAEKGDRGEKGARPAKKTEKTAENGQNGKLKVTGVIVQNSLGKPVEMREIEKFAKKHNLVVIEDLAHCVGARYPDGREAGTVGAAAVLSFGKDKVIDTTSGGAVVLRERPRVEATKAEKMAKSDGYASEVDRGATGSDRNTAGAAAAPKRALRAPDLAPKPSDRLRARFYPLFGMVARGLSYVHLSGILMRFLLKIHWVERSADNRLDLSRTIADFEAKLALGQLERLDENRVKIGKNGQSGGETRPLREFYLVRDRSAVLKKLQQQGYYFSGFWYERPVSPERYYKKVKFPEKECPVATEVAREIVNFPNYYTPEELAPARKIVEKYAIGGKNG